MTVAAVAAIDLGASSGRVMVGSVGPRTLELSEVHRFPNDPVLLPDGLHWDVLRLYHEILAGLRAAGQGSDELVSIGVDSWAIDYGLLDEAGSLLGAPYHYRDTRVWAGVEAVHAVVSRERLYSRTGLQFLPFTTIYQLATERGTARLAAARSALLIPDLIGSWLTGVAGAEATNASTTGLFDIGARVWAEDLVAALGLPPGLLPPSAAPGTTVGPIRPEVATETGFRAGTPVVRVGSHDTASAVVGVPAAHERFAYIACGTWSLVGVELDAPILTEASRLANFTNELGVDGRIRYLRNVMGLWLVQETLRTWERAGDPAELADLLGAAADLPRGGPRFDPDDPSLLPPGDMPSRIDALLRERDQRPPTTRPRLIRAILDSLADAYARAVEDAVRLSGRPVEVVHFVGGGSRNDLLCQLTADACGRSVIAGPVEATAIGNVLVQARAQGAIDGSLESLRALVRGSTALHHYEPRSKPRAQR